MSESLFGVPETHLEYAQRIGPPRFVVCDIRLGPTQGFVWFCWAHDYGFNDRPYPLDWYVRGHPLNDRCPMSRLEEWRTRVWEQLTA